MKKSKFLEFTAIACLLILALVVTGCNGDDNGTTVTYLVTVNGGTGGGEFKAGDPVTITVNADSLEQEFINWTITPSVTFTSGSTITSEATFTMPANPVTVTANLLYEIAVAQRIAAIAWTGMNVDVSNYEYFMIDDDGLLAMGNPLTFPGEWIIYADEKDSVFEPGANHKIAIRNDQTGNFITRKDVPRAAKDTDATQLKVLPFEDTDEFYWSITKEESIDDTHVEVIVYHSVNIVNYGFTSGMGGIWSYAHTGVALPSESGNATKWAVHFIHNDGDADWDDWDADGNLAATNDDVIHGTIINVTVYQ